MLTGQLPTQQICPNCVVPLLLIRPKTGDHLDRIILNSKLGTCPEPLVAVKYFVLGGGLDRELDAPAADIFHKSIELVW